MPVVNQTKSEIRAQRARTNYAKMMNASGSPGWSRQRRGRLLNAVGVLIGLGALIAGLLALTEASWKRGIAYTGFGLIVLALAWPVRRRLWPVERVVHEGAPALAVPMRAIPLRVAIVLTVVGVLVLAGGVLGGVDLLREGDVAGVVPLLFGMLAGLAIGALGAVNLAGPARNPKPLLISEQGVTWWLARLPQLVRWEDITSIDEWSKPIGVNLLNPRTNYIAIRAREGVVPGWVDNRLVAGDPAAVRDLLRHYLDNPADRATLSRDS